MRRPQTTSDCDPAGKKVHNILRTLRGRASDMPLCQWKAWCNRVHIARRLSAAIIFLVSRIRAVFALLTAVSFSAATAARAATIAPPKDLGQLLHMSDAVVYAQAMETWAEPSDGVPITVTRF